MGSFRKCILKFLCRRTSKLNFLASGNKMTINFEDIINACNIVAEQEQINVCFTESLKGAGIAGIGAFLSGVLFGPVGIAVGGAIGGYAGSQMCKKYMPLWQVIATMKHEDKVRLVNHMMKIVQGLDISDAVLLISLVTNQHAVGRKLFVDALITFANQISR